MTIAVGEKLPDATLKVSTSDGPKDRTVSEIFGGRKVILFGVPGAFTPTCSNNHLPGFLENHDAILGKGVDEIAVISVNDVHVMTAWARFTGAEGKITFIADGSAHYAKQLGLELDASAFGMGMRLKRFSMIVEDGVVASLNIEESPGQAVASGAARIMEQL